MLKVSNFNPIIVRLKLGPTIALFDVHVRFQSYNSSIKTTFYRRYIITLFYITF